jgi:hypothetical protein
MCLGAVLALVLIPLFAGAFGFSRYGVTGGWVGALAGFVAALLLVGGPVALLVNNARRKMARERALFPQDRTDRRQP